VAKGEEQSESEVQGMALLKKGKGGGLSTRDVRVVRRGKLCNVVKKV